jgi:hypothetical protein
MRTESWWCGKVPMTCGNMGAACGNRTHDLTHYQGNGQRRLWLLAATTFAVDHSGACWGRCSRPHFASRTVSRRADRWHNSPAPADPCAGLMTRADSNRLDIAQRTSSAAAGWCWSAPMGARQGMPGLGLADASCLGHRLRAQPSCAGAVDRDVGVSGVGAPPAQRARKSSFS